jgi:regulatory protein
MSKITKMEIQKKNNKRINLFLDGEYAFSISIELAYKENLNLNDEIDSKKIEELAKNEDFIRCKESALNIIEKSYKTEKEVRDKLKLKGYENGSIDKSIKFLKQYQFINDNNYTKAFINDKLNSAGSQKIRYTLIKKGIPKEIIDEELSNLNKEAEKNAALSIARKKLGAIRKNENNNYKISGKLFRYLASKGYEYDIINDVVKEVMSLEEC